MIGKPSRSPAAAEDGDSCALGLSTAKETAGILLQPGELHQVQLHKYSAKEPVAVWEEEEKADKLATEEAREHHWPRPCFGCLHFRTRQPLI